MLIEEKAVIQTSNVNRNDPHIKVTFFNICCLLVYKEMSRESQVNGCYSRARRVLISMAGVSDQPYTLKSCMMWYSSM